MNMQTNYDLTMASETVDVSDIKPLDTIPRSSIGL